MTPSPAKRIRRTPEEARRVILDAAEACMAKAGPAGLRLQDVAEVAGVSHPTILHHFESREGLIRALNLRSLQDLRERLVAAMSGAVDSLGPVAETFEAFRDGIAQRMIWILQSSPTGGPGTALPIFDEMVDKLHAIRQGIAPPGVTIDRYDTQAFIHLTTIAAFGDAVIGPRLRRAGDAQAEAAAAKRFEDWFSRLLDGPIG